MTVSSEDVSVGTFAVFVFYFQDVCKIVVNYCHTLKERVRVLSENSDPGSAINMVRSGLG